jgi:hypothetical protein
MTTETLLVESYDTRGRFLERVRVALTPEQPSFIIGRSVQAAITVDDEYVAPLHVRVQRNGNGAMHLTDLGSANGIVINGKRHPSSTELTLPAGSFQIGRTVFRIRTEHDDVAPEKLDTTSRLLSLASAGQIAAIATAACTAQLAYNSWVSAARNWFDGAITILLFVALAAAAWISVWALLSRVMRGEWRWLHHLAIFAGVLAVSTALEDVLGVGKFALNLPSLPADILWLTTPVMICAITLHLLHASNLSLKRAAIAASTVIVLITATTFWSSQRASRFDVAKMDAAMRIYPSALRLTASAQPEALFAEREKLKAETDQRLRDFETDDPDNAEMGAASIFSP